MKHIVMFSGGVGSWAAAKRVAERHGTADLVLLFADVLMEDSDTYRFLGEAARNVGGELVRIIDQEERGAVQIPADVLAANRDKLKIITIRSRGMMGNEKKEYEAATNVELFQKLMADATKAYQEKQAQGRAKKAGKAADAEDDKPAKTKQEIADGKRQREEQLGRNIGEWRERLVRKVLGEKLAAADIKKPNVPLLTLALSLWFDGEDGHGLLRDVASECTKAGRSSYLMATYGVIAPAVAGQINELQLLVRRAVVLLIAGDEHESGHACKRETLDQLFNEWGCDLVAAWQRLFTAKDPTISEFFEHHRKLELIPLAKELGVHLEESMGKPQMIDKLLNRTAPLPLPKCLQPAEKRTMKKGKK